MQHDIRRGAGFAIAAAAAFACMGAMIKFAAVELSNPMIVFLRTSLGLVMLAPWLLRPGLRGLKTRRPLAHFLRAAVGLSAMYCFFYAIPRLHLADAVLLNYSQPLFIPFIAWFWLSERPAARIYPAVVIGFIGVALIIKPTPAGFSSPAALVGLASGLLAATAMVAIRRMSDTEPTTRIVFYFSAFGTLISLGPALWFWQTPSPITLAQMLGAGLFATLGQLLLTRAYTLAPAAHVGSLIYAAVLFAALLGWAVWQEVPDVYGALGSMLVIAAGVLVVAVRRPRKPRRRTA